LEKDCHESYKLLGILIGMALLNNYQFDSYFPLAFYHLLLNEDVTPQVAEDLLYEIDSELADGITKLRKYKGVPNLD